MPREYKCSTTNGIVNNNIITKLTNECFLRVVLALNRRLIEGSNLSMYPWFHSNLCERKKVLFQGLYARFLDMSDGLMLATT